jgi:LmbE family N-acetylglucosaminyl deacetylase
VLWDGLTRVWIAGFRLAGQLHQPRVRRWHPLEGGTVVVLSLHLGDETAGCGATLLHHRCAGDRVVVVNVTDGLGSRASGLGPDQIGPRRSRETQTAAERLGVELEQLAPANLDWEVVELTNQLRGLLDRLQPDVIYVPSLVDYHHEQRKLARALAAALEQHSATIIRMFELQVPLTPLLVNLLASTGIMTWQRQAALAAYESQAQAIRPGERLRRYNEAYWGEEVECFWELSASQYRDLIATRDESERPSVYRGLRQRPARDSLCYLFGWNDRRRLRGIVGEGQTRVERRDGITG